jgi:hypothetical protein
MPGPASSLPAWLDLRIQVRHDPSMNSSRSQKRLSVRAADTPPNTGTAGFVDLRLESMFMARNSGTVRNLKDRRHGLYSVACRDS